MQNQVITYPIPVYQNLPIEPQFYQPSRFVISSITLGTTTTITTSVNHNYVIGQLCRLLIPKGYGSVQLTEQLGNVIAIPNANQVTLNLNSTNSNQFISAALAQQPQIVAVGDYNSGPINIGRTNNTTFIPGSFINISPSA
jgi:hypothetical protein